LAALEGAHRWPNLRVVVSDNSDDKTPALKSFCAAQGFDYVRPPRVLSMTAHWDWILRTFPFETAAIVTDRSYFNLPRLAQLEAEVRATGKIVSFDAGVYTEGRRFGLPVWMVSSRLMSGRSYDIPCAAMIEGLTTRFFEPALPRLMTCIIHADHLGEVRRRFPETLSSYSPDFEFGYKFICAFERDSLIFVDEALFITHSKTLSNSAYSKSNPTKATKDFFRLSGITSYPFSPLPDHMTPYSVMAHELNKVMHELHRPPLINAENLIRQEAQTAALPAKGAWRHLNTLNAIIGRSDDVQVRVGLGSALPGFDFSRLYYQPRAATILPHPAIRPHTLSSGVEGERRAA
jgi:hypothetical protein